MLKPVYEQEGQTEMSTFALDHLATCLQFIEEAERQASEEAKGQDA
jgi:hypothetical protein